MAGLRATPDLAFSPPAVALLAIALLALAAFGGCPGRTGPDFGQLPTITSDDPEAESELRKARELDERGETEAAESSYRAFLERRGKDPLAPIAELALGRLLLRRDQVAEAKQHFDRVARHPDASVAEQGRFYGAVASQRLGEHAAAVKVLQPMIGRPIDPADTSLLLRTLADGLVGLTRYGEAIAVLDTLASESVPEADRAWARGRIAELVADKASVEDIARLYGELPHDGPAWRHVIGRAVRDADAAGDTDRVRELIEVMRDEDLPIDDTLAAVAVRAERPTEANPQVVGAVLSLSGRGRRVGELALRGLMLAAGLPLSGPPEPRAPQLVFRDDGGDPERAVAAIDDLVTVHRAVAVIGPMDVRAAEAAAKRAEELGVPMILLSPAASATAQSAMVYRLFATPEDEIEALLAQAKNQEHTRVAALLPEGPYGDLMQSTMRAQAKALGLSAGEVLRYPATTTSFVEQAQALAKHPFDALVLADIPQRVALIAPALAAAGLWSTRAGEHAPAQARSITVLAPSIAFDAAQLLGVGRYLQGAMFSVPFDARVVEGSAQRFVERFQGQFGESPDTFAALAHDAYKLVRAAVDAGATTRKAVADTLWRAQSAELAGPSQGLSPEHRARRPTRVLALHADKFVEVGARQRGAAATKPPVTKRSAQ
jgi:ABC-type branched-subunit amino acid transport system substrate-binding protein